MERQRWYVGFKHDYILQAFKSLKEPTEQEYSAQYFAVMGPFRTKRAADFTAKCGFHNPHIQTVADAERIAKMQVKGEGK